MIKHKTKKRQPMNCQNCNKEIPSGADYCNFCGEKISEEILNENYKSTGWGKFEKALDKFDTIKLGKITGHWLFKVLSIIVLLVATYYAFYGDAGKMNFTKSEIYTIEYNVDTEQYTLICDEELFKLGLYIPKRADNVKYSCFNDEKLEKEEEYTPENCNIVIKKGEYEKMTIELIRNDKVTQKIEFSCK